MKVLLVNDDGVECPAFVSLLKQAKEANWIGELEAVVPAFERSWIAGAITRDALINCEEKKIEGVRVFVADGMPADCVSLAFSGLVSFKPDLVISGLNVGRNSSVAFSHSSGTLNAAKFGSLHGVPSIALSMQVDTAIKNAWNFRDQDKLKSFEPVFDRVNNYLLKASKALIDSGLLIGDSAVAHYCSFNSPFEIDENLEPILSTPTNNRFAPLFVEVAPRIYQHRFTGFDAAFKEHLDYRPELPEDDKILSDGRVAYSLFRLDYDYGKLHLPANCSERMSKSWSAL